MCVPRCHCELWLPSLHLRVVLRDLIAQGLFDIELKVWEGGGADCFMFTPSLPICNQWVDDGDRIHDQFMYLI